MADTSTPASSVPKSVEQVVRPDKKQYRATTTWHTKPMPTFRDLAMFLVDFVVERVARADLGPLEMYKPRGEDWDRGPLPSHSIWPENFFILRWAILPIALQWAFLTYSGLSIPPLKLRATQEGLISIVAYIVQFLTYQGLFILFAIHVLKRGQRLMQHYGTLNEELRGRDIVPDSQHRRVILGLVAFIFIRGMGVFGLVKDRTELPSLSVWSPIRMGGFMILLDYFFYVYHRSTHEFDSLWFVHRQHHATKSPTPSMSLWADEIQDSLEWAIVPAFAFAFIKLSLAELYIASCYVLYVEAFGHTGIRAYFTHPLLTPVLKPLNLELAIEDHDLHHRFGRGGKNYGKQTRIWDTLFGTVAERVEEKNYNARHNLL